MKKGYLFFVSVAFIAAISLLAAVPAIANPAGKINLINPSFEDGEQGPWYWWGEAGTGTYGVLESSHDGKKSVKIAADKADYIPMGFLQDFDCEPGDEVTVSVWIMSPASNPLTNSNAFVRLEFWGGEPFTLLKGYEGPHLTGAFNWTKSSVSSKAPEGATKGKIGLFIWNPGINHSGIVCFDDAEASKKGAVLF